MTHPNNYMHSVFRGTVPSTPLPIRKARHEFKRNVSDNLNTYWRRACARSWSNVYQMNMAA